MIVFDEQFFDKHQRPLLNVANRWYLSWLLGLNRLPEPVKGKRIDKITPYSIHTLTDDSNVSAIYFTRPRFAEALAFNLSPFAYALNSKQTKMIWHFSPAGVLGCLLLALFPHKIGGFAFLGTTGTFMPIPGTTVDGYVYRQSTNSTWANLRGGSGTASGYADTSTNLCAVRCGTVSNTYEFIVRSIFLFLTGSTIATTDTIISATMNVKGTLKDSTLGGDIRLDRSVPASNTALANSDYNNANHAFVAQSDTNLTLSSFSTSAYNTWTLNSTGLGNIGKGSGAITYLGFKHGSDMTDTPPSYNNGQWTYAQGYYSDYTGTSNDPYFEVNYSSGGGSSFKPFITYY